MNCEEYIERVTSVKPKESYSKQVNNVLKKISAENDTVPTIFGTYMYRANPWFSDIDTQQKVINKSRYPTKEFAKKVQNIVKKIDKSKRDGVYLGDIKSGFDYRYMFNIGELRGNSVTGYCITNYNYREIQEELATMKRMKMVTDDEYDKMSSLAVPMITPEMFIELKELLRKHFLIRWTRDEILAGRKKLPNGITLKLEDAITSNTMTKIDMIAPVDGKYLEVTNVVMPYDGEGHALGFENDRDAEKKIIEDLDVNFRKRKYLKTCKRMWSIARRRGDDEMILRLTPILQSNAGRIYQIVSEITSILLVLMTEKKIKKKLILDQLDAMKGRLVNAYDILFDEHFVFSAIDKIVSEPEKIQSEQNIELLEKVAKHLSDIANNYVLDRMKEAHIYPPPMNYLPTY